jgi:hypothetical protein
MAPTRTERKVPFVEKVYDDCTKRFTEIRTASVHPAAASLILSVGSNPRISSMLKLPDVCVVTSGELCYDAGQ